MQLNLSVTIFRHELPNQRLYDRARKQLFQWADQHDIPTVANVSMEAMLADPSALAAREPPFVREMMGSQVVMHLRDPDGELVAAVDRLCAALDKQKVAHHRSDNLRLEEEEILALDWVWIMGLCPEAEQYGEDDPGAPPFTRCEEGPAQRCPACDGVIEDVTQASDLSVHPDYLDADGEMPWDFANASNGALVISRRALEWLRDRKLRGYDTRPVRQQGGKTLAGLLQLQAAQSSVSLSPTKHALHPTSCLVCRRDTSAGDPVGYLDEDPRPDDHFMAWGPHQFVRGAVARELAASGLTGFVPSVGLRIISSDNQ